MDVVSIIKVLEIDGSDVYQENHNIRVHNHGIDRDKIQIEIAGGKTYTVYASKLIKAIENAINV